MLLRYCQQCRNLLEDEWLKNRFIELLRCLVQTRTKIIQCDYGKDCVYVLWKTVTEVMLFQKSTRSVRCIFLWRSREVIPVKGCCSWLVLVRFFALRGSEEILLSDVFWMTRFQKWRYQSMHLTHTLIVASRNERKKERPEKTELLNNKKV